jgi:uncharacterized protein GlcG (DUF336 family)
MFTLEDATNVIAAAERKAKELEQPMNIAVADAGGNLIAHVRMEEAWIGSIDIAIKNDFTARAFEHLHQRSGDVLSVGRPAARKFVIDPHGSLNKSA